MRSYHLTLLLLVLASCIAKDDSKDISPVLTPVLPPPAVTHEVDMALPRNWVDIQSDLRGNAGKCDLGQFPLPRDEFGGLCGLLEWPVLLALDTYNANFSSIPVPPDNPLGLARKHGPIVGAGMLLDGEAKSLFRPAEFSSYLGSDPFGKESGGSIENHLAGLHIDALSIAQDNLRLDWKPGSGMEVDSGRWQLGTFAPGAIGQSWALITFTELFKGPRIKAKERRLFAIAWGHREGLKNSGLFSSPVPLFEGDSFGDFGVKLLRLKDAPDLKRVSGMDLNAWHVLENSLPSRCAPLPIQAKSNKDHPKAFKVYFSITGSPDSMKAMKDRLGSGALANSHWKTGAAIFSVRWKPKQGWGEPKLEFSPFLTGRGSLNGQDNPDSTTGFVRGDDIDALAIDPCRGIAIASLTKNSPTFKDRPSSFYAWGFADSSEGTILSADHPRNYPTPLHHFNGNPLDDEIGHGLAMEVGTRDHHGRPVDPDSTCAPDPEQVN